CLHKLRGEFAIVLWDSTHRALFAARDRFGIEPLFYAFHDVIQENIVNIAVSLRDIGVCRGSSPNNLVPEGVRTELFIQDDLGIVPDVEVQMKYMLPSSLRSCRRKITASENQRTYEVVPLPQVSR